MRNYGIFKVLQNFKDQFHLLFGDFCTDAFSIACKVTRYFSLKG